MISGSLLSVGTKMKMVLRFIKTSNTQMQDHAYSKPVRQMKMMSIGDFVSRLLTSDEARKLMMYRHEYQHQVGVYNDYFDGAEYQNLLATTDLFSSEHDVALALFADGFRADGANKGSKLAILHLVNMNIPPYLRFQKEYLLQLGPGPKTPDNVDSFLKPILAEFADLSKHWLLVRRDGVEICRARVNLVMATGDIPAVAALAGHASHSGAYDCRLCRIKAERIDNCNCFNTFNNDIRPNSDFFGPNEFGMNAASVFSSLSNFTGVTFFGLEEMHMFGQGIAKQIYELLTTTNKDNSCSKLAVGRSNYTFHIPKKDLYTINKLINASRATIPSSFASKWRDPVTNTVKNRAVDWLDVFLYMVPDTS